MDTSHNENYPPQPSQEGSTPVHETQNQLHPLEQTQVSPTQEESARREVEPISHTPTQGISSPQVTQHEEGQSGFTPPGPPIIPSHQDDFEEESRFPLILKIIIGIFVIGIIGFLLFGLLLPRLSKNQSSGKVTLEYWGLWEDSNIMQSIIADFERQNPTITVHYNKQDPKQYSERLLTRIQNNTGPDIFRYHNSWLPMMLPVLSPLPTDVISKEEFTKNYYPVIQQDLAKNGAVYGIPLEIDTLALYVNSSLVDATGTKIPTTWTDFITAARSMTVKDEAGKIKTAGAALGTFDNITHAPDVLSLLLVQNGANLTQLDKTTQNASDALTFYTSFAKDQGNVWDATLDPSLLAFSKGNLAMYFGYSWDMFTIKAVNPNLQFTINPVPHLPGRTMTIASYWVEGVSNKSKHQKEADLFMKFLTQKTTLQKLYTEQSKTRPFGEPYPRSDMASLLKDNIFLKTFIAQASNATSSIFAGETQDTGINAQLNGYLGNAVRAILGNTSPQTAVDTLAQGVAQVINRYAGK